MTIDEMKDKRVALSSAIHGLIREFESETGLTVDAVSLCHGMRMDERPVLIDVKLEVKL